MMIREITLAKTYRMYTGKSGLYVSVVPTRAASIRLVSFVEHNRLCRLTPVDISEFHVTIMYCREGIPQVGPVSPGIRMTLGSTYTAQLVGVEWWKGHDEEGYLVGKLQSDDLIRCHNNWKAQGATHSFNEYIPHITIQTPYPEPSNMRAINSVNTQLLECPLLLTFENECVEDINL